MITLQPSKEIPPNETVSKKRKWDQDIHEKPVGNLRKIKPASILEQNQTQVVSPGWQPGLDIKSGKAYLYNARTSNIPLSSTNTCSDPRPMSLELKLNLPHQSTSCTNGLRFMDVNIAKEDVKGLVKSPSWLSLEGEQQEMVATVCKKCYMLVMMSKSSRSCPNCKFVHPLEPVQTFLFKGN